MAIDPSQYQAQGQQYAQSLAASQDPLIGMFRNRLGSMRSREQLAQEIQGLYNPVLGAAMGVGQNVANVGAAGLSALTGVASSLPGVGVEGLSEAYRSAGRAGGSAALMGSALETSARQALAESILQRQGESEQARFATEEQLAGSEAEKARLGADWLSAAQGLQGMGQVGQQMQFAAESQPLELEQIRANIASIMSNTSLTDAQKANLIQQTQFEAELQPGRVREQEANINLTRQQTRQIRNEIRSAPAPQVARRLATQLMRGEVTMQGLQRAGLMNDLRNAGIKFKTSGGRTTVVLSNGQEIDVSPPAVVQR